MKSVLEILNAKLPDMKHDAWVEEVEALKNKYPLKFDDDRLTGPYVVEELYRVTKGDAIITTEVGQNQMWAAQYYKYKEPRTFLTSGGLGTMGYGLGAGIGAKIGCPEKTVVNVAGDGCFRMNMNEIATAARYQVPIIELVLNNHVLGYGTSVADPVLWTALFRHRLKRSGGFRKAGRGHGRSRYACDKEGRSRSGAGEGHCHGPSGGAGVCHRQ